MVRLQTSYPDVEREGGFLELTHHVRRRRCKRREEAVETALEVLEYYIIRESPRLESTTTLKPVSS